MLRKSLLSIFSICLVACSGQNVPEFNQSELQPGGGMTTKRLSDRSYVVPGKNVDRMQELSFWTGFSLFRDPWVIAPSSTKDRDGLGPLFNTRSCISCHTAGGRGLLPIEALKKPAGLVIRLGPMTSDGPLTDQNYGGQIQPFGIPFHHSRLEKPPVGEASVKVVYSQIKGSYPDGTPYILQYPEYSLEDLAYGERDKALGLSPRMAPSMVGVGLLDAIAESDLLSQEDVDDSNSNGISPRYNRVPDEVNGGYGIGRFGHKSKHPSLFQQVAAAFRDDIGITSDVFPEESCTDAQPICKKASSLGGHSDVEIPDKLLKLVVDFSQGIGVPPARNLDSENVQQGRQLFHTNGCAQCHTPSYQTSADYPVNYLANQTIWPYTNLALHDMGDKLADGIHEYSAQGNEWRTPPLWGIGLQQAFKQHTGFLHDGRARTIEEAILWHGGEAEQSKQLFMHLSNSERQALLAFLKAI